MLGMENRVATTAAAVTRVKKQHQHVKRKDTCLARARVRNQHRHTECIHAWHAHSTCANTLATLPGSLRVREASMSPAAMMLPADSSWLMMPDSVA